MDQNPDTQAVDGGNTQAIGGGGERGRAADQNPDTQAVGGGGGERRRTRTPTHRL